MWIDTEVVGSKPTQDALFMEMISNPLKYIVIKVGKRLWLLLFKADTQE